MPIRFSAIFFLSLFLLVSGLIYSQESNERPKVGLVLSGGGAKGLAHIGVLKVLEEAGIRPDFITGTSMGGIIGGLYAIGYNAKELDSIGRRLDWGQLLSDGIPLSDVLPEEKHDYHRFHVELNITRNGLSSPAGFVGGHSISELFSRLSWRMAGVESFSDFPIPFKCVATDLISGEQYVFEDGDLTTALRSTMSIPSVFSPVQLDSLLLIDGGVLNNFPVLLCRQMGADIIIGVNVGSPDLVAISDLGSPPSVLSAAAMIGNNLSMRMQLPFVDYLISPDLAGYTAASFFDAHRIIDIGEVAARNSFEELAALAARLDEIGPHIPRPVPVQPETIRIEHIQVKGLERISHRFFLGNLGIESGDVITAPTVERGISRLMGTRYFDSVSYRLIPVDNGYLLAMEVHESERARFKFSLHYDNEYKAGIITNVTLRNILLRGNRFSSTLDISERPRFNLSAISYYGEKQRSASRIEVDLENNTLPVYLEDGAQYGSFIQNYSSAWFGVMLSASTSWESNCYIQYERSVLKRESGFYDIFFNGVDKFGNSFVTLNFKTVRNDLNRRHFPTRGSLFNFRYRYYLQANDVYKGSGAARSIVQDAIEPEFNHLFQLNGSWEQYFRITRRLVVNPRVQAGYASRSLPIMGLNYVGGMPFQTRTNEINFVGLSLREKIVQNYLMAQLNVRYRFMRKMHASAIINGLAGETGGAEDLRPVVVDRENHIFGYGLLLEYDSFLGPIQIGASNSNVPGGVRWYVGFGYSF